MRQKMSGIQFGKYALGDQLLEGGNYESMNSLGELQAKNSRFHELSILGNALLETCDITKLSILGNAKVSGGKIDLIELTGELKLQGSVHCGGIHVLGSLESEDTTCCILKFGSVRLPKIKHHKPLLIGSYHGDTLENFLPLHLDGK